MKKEKRVNATNYAGGHVDGGLPVVVKTAIFWWRESEKSNVSDTVAKHLFPQRKELSSGLSSLNDL